MAEGAGLLKSDFSDQEGTLCVHINPHPWRSLKTPSSKRLIPLVGSAKWAAEQILDQTSENTFAFPTYNYKQRTNANSASASLNKWLKGRIGQPFSIHSFRHSMRDRFREVDCPSEVIDQIGGWGRSDVSDSYGEGYSLPKMHKYLEKITQLSQYKFYVG